MREKSPSHHSPPSATTGDRILPAAAVMAAKSPVPYGRPLFSVRDGVTWTFGTAEAAFLYGTELRGHSVQQKPLFCTGRGYVYIPYGSPLFAVRGCCGLCTVHCGASRIGKSRFLYGTRAWACKPARAEKRRTRLSSHFHRQQAMAGS